MGNLLRNLVPPYPVHDCLQAGPTWAPSRAGLPMKASASIGKVAVGLFAGALGLFVLAISLLMLIGGRKQPAVVLFALGFTAAALFLLRAAAAAFFRWDSIEITPLSVRYTCRRPWSRTEWEEPLSAYLGVGAYWLRPTRRSPGAWAIVLLSNDREKNVLLENLGRERDPEGSQRLSAWSALLGVRTLTDDGVRDIVGFYDPPSLRPVWLLILSTLTLAAAVLVPFQIADRRRAERRRQDRLEDVKKLQAIADHFRKAGRDGDFYRRRAEHELRRLEGDTGAGK